MGESPGGTPSYDRGDDFGQFYPVARHRPVDLVRPEAARPVVGRTGCAVLAPQVGLTATWRRGDAVPAKLTLEAPGLSLSLRARRRLVLTATPERGAAVRAHSLRCGGIPAEADGVALTVTGPWLTAWWHGPHGWRAGGRLALHPWADVVRSPSWLGSLSASADGVRQASVGPFGQLGLRDLRWVSDAEGTPYRAPGSPDLWLTATSAGASFFDTCHTSVWRLHPDTLRLTHSADLHFTRDDARNGAVFGDCAVQLIRERGEWLVLTSGWGDFDRAHPAARVRVRRGRSSADLLHGQHVVPTTLWPLPGHEDAVGQWDPCALRHQERWWVGYVQARRYFVFNPALASGPTLDDVTQVGQLPGRSATEGTHFLPLPTGQWLLGASDGPQGHPGHARRYPLADFDLKEVGTLHAPYGTNLPWPMVTPFRRGYLMVTFDGTPFGGPALGYGTHGDVLILRSDGASAT